MLNSAWVIIFRAPGAGQEDGAGEADQVEQPPRLEPGNGGDAEVQDGQIREKRQMVLAAGGGQNRRGETAQRSHRRQRQRILQDGQQHSEDRNAGQYRETGLGRDQRIQLHGGQRRQIEDADARPLQDQAVAVLSLRQRQPASSKPIPAAATPA